MCGVEGDDRCKVRGTDTGLGRMTLGPRSEAQECSAVQAFLHDKKMLLKDLRLHSSD